MGVFLIEVNTKAFMTESIRVRMVGADLDGTMRAIFDEVSAMWARAVGFDAACLITPINACEGVDLVYKRSGEKVRVRLSGRIRVVGAKTVQEAQQQVTSVLQRAENLTDQPIIRAKGVTVVTHLSVFEQLASIEAEEET